MQNQNQDSILSPEREGVVAYLSEHLHFAVVDEDVVVLDERTDAYSCLPGAGAVIQVHGERIVGPGSVIAQLRESGFLGDPGPARVRAPPAPTRALPLPLSSEPNLIAATRFWWSWWREGRRFESRSLADLLATHRRRSRSPGLADVEIARLTSTFVRLLPWAPGRVPACIAPTFCGPLSATRAGTRSGCSAFAPGPSPPIAGYRSGTRSSTTNRIVSASTPRSW